MALSVGLRVTDELSEAMTAARSGSTRALVIRADREDELLTLDRVVAAGNDVAADFDAVGASMEKAECRIILISLDATGDSDKPANSWVLVQFTPDDSSVKDRMITASSVGDIKRELLGGLSCREFSASELSEFNYESYQRWVDNDAPEAAMTASEKVIAKEESAARAERTGGGAGTHAVPFDFTPEASDAIKSFASGSVNLVLLAVNEKEEIALDSATTAAGVAEMASALPESNPRFAVLAPEESKEGNGIFVFSCPDEARIREKMLYSTAKSTVAAALEGLGVTVQNKLEVSSGPELVDDINGIKREAMTPSSSEPTGFAKPKRPGRGKRAKKKLTI